MDAFAKVWAVDRQFTPRMNADARDTRYARWGRAVNAVLAV
jgi:glycerol kinase